MVFGKIRKGVSEGGERAVSPHLRLILADLRGEESKASTARRSVKWVSGAARSERRPTHSRGGMPTPGDGKRDQKKDSLKKAVSLREESGGASSREKR